MLGPPTFKKGEIFEESLDFYAIQWWCHAEIWTGPSFLTTPHPTLSFIHFYS